MLYILKSTLIAFLISLASTYALNVYLRKKGIGQKVSTDAPKRHLKKEGTPNMGGLAIALSTCLAYWLMGGKDLKLPASLLGFASIGFIDDFLSVKRGKSLGLKARHKLLFQSFLSLLLLLTIPELDCKIHIPGRVIYFDLGYFYPAFALLLIVGYSNAFNLTDGLDGLAGGCSAAVAGGMAFVALSLMEQEKGIFLASIGGACLGFLWLNLYPAKIIMGDTGSLALGGSLAFSAILLKEEIIFIIMSLVFLAEAISVIIQVVSFKTTGKRVFKMTPIHHHFELSGWEEPLITTRFWLVTIFMVLLASLLAVMR
ncbi:MAG: phospho-N-acetylmuramoyl-pentapeptide-transferase [bacterium]